MTIAPSFHSVVPTTVAAGGGGEGGHSPRAALSRGRHFKEDFKMRPVYAIRLFKYFTALDIRPPELFCDV